MATGPTAYAGIDLGTYSTSLATCAPGGRIRIVDKYADQLIPSCKTLSMTLYSEEQSSGWQPVAFGWSAYVMYQNLRPQQQDCHVLLESFKSCLAAEGLCSSPASTAQLPVGLTCLKVMTDFLVYLKDLVLAEFKQAATQDTAATDVLWSLSIPALWSDRAKRILRQAALDAGLITRAILQNVVMVYESEATAVAIVKQHVRPFAVAEGRTFMVVDIGAGNVDITSHKIRSHDDHLALADLTHPDGLLTGSNEIDAHMRDFLKQQLGTELWDAVHRQHPHAMTKLTHESWQDAKNLFDGTKGATVQLPAELVNALPVEVLHQLAGQNCPQGTLLVPCATLKAWYDAVITQLIPVIECPLERAKSNGAAVEYLVMTGGMASSAYLTAKLKEALGTHVQDICYPSVLYQTVLTGAILYAQNPEVVHSRRSRLAYAVHDDMLWYLGKPYHTLLSEGLTHPDSHLGLQPLVQVDEVLARDHVVSHDFTARWQFQQTLAFGLFSYDSNKPLSKSVNNVDIVHLSCHDYQKVSEPKEYRLTASFSFDGTECCIRAKHCGSGQKVNVSIDL